MGNDKSLFLQELLAKKLIGSVPGHHDRPVLVDIQKETEAVGKYEWSERFFFPWLESKT